MVAENRITDTSRTSALARKRKAVRRFITNRDARNRVTLKVRGVELADYYEAEVYANGEIHLHPRVLVAPEDVVSARTSTAIANSVANAIEGKVGPMFDPAAFADLLDEDDET